MHQILSCLRNLVICWFFSVTPIKNRHSYARVVKALRIARIMYQEWPDRRLRRYAHLGKRHTLIKLIIFFLRILGFLISVHPATVGHFC
jgi:hypothetical protein